ncbi:MAG: GMC family oxidoreductase [Pseudomonadota bacterium]
MSEHLCDFLIVGGGAAGCIVARRLAENTSLRVILIEAGRSDENDPAAMDLSRLEEQDETYDWNFLAQTMSGAAAPIEYARARMLGGCANHNDCAFIPPTPTDLKAWSRAGGELWNLSHLDACLARIEDKIHIEEAPQGNALSRAFIDAALDLGLPERNFRKGAAEGAGWFPLNARGSLRQSSSIGYLHPLDALPQNLVVWTDTNVTRLKLDGHRIKGAETSRGSVTVAREVILCAGSINTPQLMMVSGLGPGNHLKEFGIDVHMDLPRFAAT